MAQIRRHRSRGRSRHLRRESAQERFDYQVRGDMFRAFGGNEAAFKNAMSIIDAKLREDPDHAEALVWRGGCPLLEGGAVVRRWQHGQRQSFG
jgi:hypothetical protein